MSPVPQGTAEFIAHIFSRPYGTQFRSRVAYRVWATAGTGLDLCGNSKCLVSAQQPRTEFAVRSLQLLFEKDAYGKRTDDQAHNT
jgi:hypothetical protein